MSLYYLYKITTPNQKIYIGVTDNPQERWNHHCIPSSKYKSAVGAAIQKYG
ncbi:MAG: GIY-YIG nuclease family protein [Cyanobacteria bacterium SBLK]|nr:GIY-YIG nuclease family protein [Cyanobacteria bacterium SBLK]